MSKAPARTARSGNRARPQVEVAFLGSRAAATFLAGALARPEIHRGDVELTGPGRRFRLRLSVDSWRPAPAELPEEGLGAHLIRMAKGAGGTVRPAPAGPEGAADEVADLAAELRAIQAEVERLTRLAQTAAAQDELGWERPAWLNGALRLERGLTAAAEPLGRLLAILEGLSQDAAP